MPATSADAWQAAPAWAVELRELIVATMNQNELILTKLTERPTYLTPADQAKLDQVFKTLAADTAKLAGADPAAAAPAKA